MCCGQKCVHIQIHSSDYLADKHQQSLLYDADSRWSDRRWRNNKLNGCKMEVLLNQELLSGSSHTVCLCVCVLSDFNPPWRESSLQEQRFIQRHIILTIQQKDKQLFLKEVKKEKKDALKEGNEDEFELTMTPGRGSCLQFGFVCNRSCLKC